ncbi:family 2 glycosyl transferase, partial [Escherichia coli]|nr:family 2 glycosyl transferase [Escherichia coli]
MDADTLPIEAGGTSHATAEVRALVLQSGMFDAAWYSVHIPEVDGSEALDHFLSIGGSHGISPSQHFDSQYYLIANADVAKAGLNPLVHYLKFGRRE